MSTSAALALPGVEARSAIERERIRLYRHPESFDVPAATAVVRRVSGMLRAHGDALGRARADYLMADLTWLAGDAEGTYAHAERMLAHARRAESGVDIATALLFMAWCLIQGPCPVPEAIARFDALDVDASELRAVELTAKGCRAAFAAMTGRFDEAESAMAEALSGLAEMQLSAISVYMAFLAGWIATAAGDAAAAERALRDVLTLIRDPDDHWYLSMIQADLTQAMLAQGRIAEAAEAIAELDARPIPCDTEWVILRHIAGARLAACTGEHRSGLADARSAVAIAERTDLVVIHANALCVQAELLAATGDATAASAAVGRALELQEAKASTVARRPRERGSCPCPRLAGEVIAAQPGRESAQKARPGTLRRRCPTCRGPYDSPLASWRDVGALRRGGCRCGRLCLLLCDGDGGIRGLAGQAAQPDAASR